MRHVSSLLAASAAVALTVTGLTVQVATGPATARSVVVTGRVAAAVPAPTPIAWHACADPYLRQNKGQCGTLRVPLDHANPGGPQISLAVSRVRHTRGPSRGAMFTNPGGPGGSGTYLAAYGQYYGAAGRSYDWYGMDPRGVGESSPALSCNGRVFGFDREPYRPSTKKILDYWIHKTVGYARDCGRSPAKRLLPFMRTVDNVADFESFRRAIGASKVSFFGYSYGTYIAQVYATLHPSSLKRVVMDGVVDPQRVFYLSNLDQDRAFEVTIRRFFAWVGARDKTFHLGRSGKAVRATYLRLQRELTRKPAAGGTVGPDELDDALLPAGYYNLTWQGVAAALAELDRGNAKPIQLAYRNGNPVGKGADNGYAVYLATECTDAPWPSDWSRWGRDNRRVDRTAPYFTWGNAWFNAPCRTWPAASHARTKVSGRAFTMPVLLISETLDAATPFAGALSVRGLFPTARLLEGVGGTSHAVSSYNPSPCMTGAISRYLATGALPKRAAGRKADKRCPALAPPAQATQGRIARAARPLVLPVSRP